MRTTSFAAAVAVLMLGLSGERPAQAAEITVRAGMGVVSSVRDLAPVFEKMTGHKVIVIFDPTPVMNEKINSGAPADIAAVQPQQVDELIKQGKMVAGTHTNFAQAGVGVAVRRERRSRTSARSRPSRPRCSKPSRSAIPAAAAAPSPPM
jgi:molybdate transport system substrate-binding protein